MLITDFPYEILLSIIKFFNINNTIAFIQTCKRFHTSFIITNLPELGKIITMTISGLYMIIIMII